MSNKEFTMNPAFKEDFKKKVAVPEAATPDAQQTGQRHVSQESKLTEGASPTEPRDVTDIKKEILHHWCQAEQSFLEVGRLLIEVKKLVGHGSWLKWLNGNTEISYVTAQRLMRLAEEYASNASPVTHLGFSKRCTFSRV